MGKKKSKSTGIQPWHDQYKRLNLHQVIIASIPKRIRSIEAAKTRLNLSRSAHQIDVDRALIEKNLADIEDAYSRIRRALLDGQDMGRWKEFPGLEAVVAQVNGIDLSDVQAKKVPGSSFQFLVPKFVDETPLHSTKHIIPDHVATGANGEPLRKRIEDKIKVEDDDEIEEGEIIIKHEDEDDPGVSLDLESPERLPSPEPEDLSHHPQPEPHHVDYADMTGSANYAPGPPAHWMLQSPFHQTTYLPSHCYHLPTQYRNPSFPAFYTVTPFYTSGSISIASAGGIGPAYQQFQYGADYQYPPSHAAAQEFYSAVPTPPEASSGALLPAPSFPSPGLAPSSPLLPPKSSPKPITEKAPPSNPLAAKTQAKEWAAKRKLSDSPGYASDTSRAPKRRLSAHGNAVFGLDDKQHNRTKFPRSASVPPDFGTWFQEQVADRKKKLSQLERIAKPTGDKNGALIPMYSLRGGPHVKLETD